jgi:predicted TIM-barrel fold metal-dependent hydrolase
MRKHTLVFQELIEFIAELPLVDCHDHSNKAGPVLKDPLQALVDGYFMTDVISVTSDEDGASITNTEIPWEERWPIFEKQWRLAKNTGYGMVLKRVLKEFYDIDELTFDALKSMEGRLLQLEDEKIFDDILEKAKIQLRIADIWDDPQVPGRIAQKSVLDGTLKLPPRGKITIPLRDYHDVFWYEEVQQRMSPLNRHVTSLDQYLEGCFEIFKAYKAFGAVAFKDQTPYRRAINYGNPTKAEAEKVFNHIMIHPRDVLLDAPSMHVLDDYLFHELLRMVKEIDLPVQLHTGLLAGVRQDVSKANAIQLAPVLELHRDVRFDLFHANWPYSGEWLFLGKNYSNVYLDFCWANIIDPVGIQALYQQAISCVPMGKFFLFGSDFGGYADHAWAHAQIAKENLAIALANMVEIDYLVIDEAKAIATHWCYENPRKFFQLELPEIS